MTREPVRVAPRHLGGRSPGPDGAAADQLGTGRRRAYALGILTAHDAIRLAGEGLDLHTTPVSACMSQPLHTIGPDRFAYEVAPRMRALGVRHLVVEDAAGRLVGILGRRDLLRDIQDAQVRLLRRTVAVQGKALREARAQLCEQGLLRAMFDASPAGINLRDR